jgi:uncharacterized membrane protein YgdD (TMEM256/DUF423 family)
MSQLFVMIGSVAAGLGVMLGAFGAHALRGTLSNTMLTIYQTGVHYQQIHALGLILVGVLLLTYPQASGGLTLAGWLMILGIVLFSGSLYLLALTEIKVLGAVTPVGGLAFIAAWLCIVWTIWRQP